MQITAYSYEVDNGTEFYCYLKSNAGSIAEAVGSGFVRTFARAFFKLRKKENIMRYQVKPCNNGFAVIDSKLTDKGYSDTLATVSFRMSEREANEVPGENNELARAEAEADLHAAVAQ
jgi:hypothetical protein